MSSDKTNKVKSIEELAEERRKEFLSKLNPYSKPVEPTPPPQAEKSEESLISDKAVIDTPAEDITKKTSENTEQSVVKSDAEINTDNLTEEIHLDKLISAESISSEGKNIPVENIIEQLAELNNDIDKMDTTIHITAEPVASPVQTTSNEILIDEIPEDSAHGITKIEVAVENEDVITGNENKIPPTINEDGKNKAANDVTINEIINHGSDMNESKQDAVADANKLATDFDAHLFSNGTYYKVYEKFGAQITNEGGVEGVRFTTWAPNANAINIIGEFNGWQEGAHQMMRIHDSGLWSAFIPGLKEGDTYKYSINSQVDGNFRRKIDPYAFRSEHRPKDASIVHDINKYAWKDSAWMDVRSQSTFKDKPVNIYELHLGSWRRDYEKAEYANEWGYLSYGQLANEIVAYVKKMGYTHIEILPVMEHPLDISWGYQVTHYFAPSSRFGEPQDFMYFVDHCHQNGIGVILDWVPAHFPSDEHALANFDGKQIYAYQDWKKGFHKDWNTYVFDYSRPQVWNFLISSALFWLEKYHIDGLRVDAVASMLYLDYSREHGEWEPNIHGGRENLEAIEFLKHLNDIVHKYHPDVMMIAEESTAWPGVSHTVADGGLGFDMKWNMGWMNDILLYFSKEPVHRKFHQGKITFSLWYAFSENFVLPISHDEVVHGKKSLLEKMPGDTWQKFANLRLFLGFMMGHPGKKLNFMTTDIAQYNEWNSEQSLEWNLLELVEMNRKLNEFVKDINHLYTSHPAMYELDFTPDGFHWIDFSDALNSVLSFYRVSKDGKQIVLFTFNMTPTVRYDYTIGVPEKGFYKEIFNSDAEIYGGSGIGNYGGHKSTPTASKNWENSIKVTLPPLALNIYLLERADTKQIEPGIETVEDYYVDEDTGGGE